MTTLAAEPNIYPSNLLNGFIALIDTVDRAIAVESGDEIVAGTGAETNPEQEASLEQEVALERAWWVLRTKARQEKAIARELCKRQTPFYLPLKAERRFLRGKPNDAYFPMFPGYVFLYASPDERVASLKTNRVAQVLPVFDERRFLKDLSQIERLVASELELTVERLLEPGRRVRVVSGGLEGVEGVVISRRGANRLFVSVDLIGQGVSLEIDDFLVQPLD